MGTDEPGGRRGWTNIHATDNDHSYPGNRWVPGLCPGYEHPLKRELAEFFKSLDDPSAEKRHPDFRQDRAVVEVKKQGVARQPR